MCLPIFSLARLFTPHSLHTTHDISEDNSRDDEAVVSVVSPLTDCRHQTSVCHPYNQTIVSGHCFFQPSPESQWATQAKEKIISLMFPEAAGGNLELSAVAGGLTDVSHTRLLLC